MQPGLLIASPQMADPNFAKAVVLMCHYDEGGALGLIINRGTRLGLQEVLDELDLRVLPDRSQETVLWGGPVEAHMGFVVYQGQVPHNSGWQLQDHIAVTPSLGVLKDLVHLETPFHLCLGYAGWGPGQLDQEIASGSWLYSEARQGLVFETPVEERYLEVMRELGLQHQWIPMSSIDA